MIAVAEEASACGSERLLLVEAVGNDVQAASRSLQQISGGCVLADEGKAMVDRGKGKAATAMVAGLQREGVDGDGIGGRWLRWLLSMPIEKRKRWWHD
ncbi:hypothetical protein GW17_00042985 [Ensete ventricosum]|nr:hypothetical protein GW17_00042985 [Ensete ventricosum]